VTTPAKVRAPGRSSELAMIHIAAKELNMCDDSYRALLWTVARVRSAKDLDLAGREAVLKHMVSHGWKDPRHPRRGRGPVYAKGSQAALIRHLWTQLAKSGAIADGSEKALVAFVRHQSQPYHPQRVGWDHPNLLPSWVASKVIEHLKAWCDRLSEAP